jgi:hypothetical protein
MNLLTPQCAALVHSAPLTRLLLVAFVLLTSSSGCGETESDSDEGMEQITSADPTTPSGAGGADEPADAPQGTAGSGAVAECGEKDQVCCAGDVCNNWRLVCSDGQCEDCGKDEGQKCCVDPTRPQCGSTPDGAVLGCGNGETCELCGEPGQPCCLDENDEGREDDEYDVCGSSTDHVCDLATRTCEECGGPGGLCCEYGACSGGGECTGLVAGEANGTCAE